MNQPLAFALVVTDGITLRTIHPASLGHDAEEVERILRHHLFGAAPAPSPARSTSTMTQREIASAQGYTGDCCGSCGSFAMRRAGTCLTCQACGGSTGCG